MAGNMPAVNGQAMDGLTDGQAQDIEMAGPSGMDRAAKLKSRLYSYAPMQAATNPNSLRFIGVTQAQARRMTAPLGPKIVPLPSLQQYQARNQPSFIHRKNREAIDARKVGRSGQEPEAKRMKRQGSVEPLERPDLVSPLPDLPRDLQYKQEEMVLKSPTPPEQLAKPASPRGRIHVESPTQPASTKPKFAASYEGLRDMHKIIDIVKTDKKAGFLYLSPAVPKSSVHYHYYNLKVVGHEHLYKPDHCTLSAKGVMRMRNDDETEFITLDRWEQEVFYFEKLIKIPTFALFRKWKAFSVWRKNVRSHKIKSCKKSLNENLFIVNPSLRPALLNVREMCHRISEMGLCQIDKDRTYTLSEFREAQFNQLNDVAGRLQDFRELVKEVVRSACRTALLEAGFTPDDYFYDGADSPGIYGEAGGAPGTASSYLMQSNYDMDIYGEAPDKMTYTEQANKRAHCKRLTCFIRLADYLIVNTMHVLAVNSVSTLLNYLTEQLQNTPTLAQIQGQEEEPEEEEKDKEGDKASEEEEEVHKLPPLFITEFILEPNQLLFSPDGDDFQEGSAEVIKRFQDAVLSVQNLVPDTYFDAFTRPIINNKFEEKTCGEGPSLATMFEDDKHLQTIIHNIREAILAAFNAASQYADTFEAFREFYRENELLDLEAVKRQEHDVAFFGEHLDKYHKQHNMAVKIKEKRPIGMLLVDATKMKGLLIPSPLRCLDVIDALLPVLARKEVDRLIAELQDAQFRLEAVPTTTLEFVHSLTFLDEVQIRIDPLEREAMVVKDMYELIDEYKVPTPPEDFAVYQTLNPSITNVRNAIDKSLAERDGNIDRFCTHLDKDITELGKEVKEVKQEAQNPMILDASADKDRVVSLLKKLLNQMEELQQRAYTYKSYQKNFKVEVTKFDALEEAHAELKLKDLLWKAIDEWDNLLQDWTGAQFDTLDPEEMNQTTMKYAKNVMQLEKGLPPNGVVPLLKEKVDLMRDRLPVITDLRNPTLKQRHWDVIEEVLDFHFTEEEPLTLGQLEKIHAFRHSERLQEISGQASSEASLEAILKKVEDSWKTTEFIVLPHKDSKDVYILGGTDDIQQLLDDSNINVATIASSRHVGPIESRVNDWGKQLDLFGKTLVRIRGWWRLGNVCPVFCLSFLG